MGFIKITMSNLPHPQGKFQRCKIELYFQNKSCKSMLVDPKNVFGPDPNPKNSHEGPKKAQDKAKLKMIRKAFTSKPKVIVYINRSPKKYWSWPQPQKSPQKGQKGPKWVQTKNEKIGIQSQNQSWQYTLVGLKKMLNLTPTQKIVPKDPKRAKKNSIGAKLN